jgi:hypothetical protein
MNTQNMMVLTVEFTRTPLFATGDFRSKYSSRLHYPLGRLTPVVGHRKISGPPQTIHPHRPDEQ